MNDDKRQGYLVRESVLKLLSDEEVARVSLAETTQGLSLGDEYVDLDHLDQGVRKALHTTAVKMDSVLPRKAVREETWRKIVTQLKDARSAPPSNN